MTAPLRSHGFTQEQRQRQCSSKRRYPDMMTAKAAGQICMERKPVQLWVYYCSLCRGWHLTRSDNGRRRHVHFF